MRMTNSKQIYSMVFQKSFFHSVVENPGVVFRHPLEPIRSCSFVKNVTIVTCRELWGFLYNYLESQKSLLLNKQNFKRGVCA